MQDVVNTRGICGDCLEWNLNREVEETWTVQFASVSTGVGRNLPLSCRPNEAVPEARGSGWTGAPQLRRLS
jgi:hypothetical protein